MEEFLRGTHQEMFDSLKKLKSSLLRQKFTVGMNIRKKNLDFCKKFDPNNIDLEKSKKIINSKLRNKSTDYSNHYQRRAENKYFLRCNDLDHKKH